MSTGYKSNYPTSGYASETQLRNEFQKIQDALEDTISRTATGIGQGQDNSMHADLDLNNNDVFGVGTLASEEIRTQELTIGGVGIQTQVDRAKQEADRAERAAEELAGPFSFLGDYGPGLVATSYIQAVRDSDGQFWRVSGQVDLPYTTTGTGLPEGDAFVPAGDAVLRQDLANPYEGAGLIAYGGTTVESALGDLEQFNADLSDPDKGAALVAYGEGTVADKLDEIVSGAVTEPIVDAKVLAHNHDPSSHPELRSSIVSDVSAHVTAEADRAEAAAGQAAAAGLVYESSAAGQTDVNLAEGDYFFVVSADSNEVLALWQKGDSTPTDTGKRTFNAGAFLKTQNQSWSV